MQTSVPRKYQLANLKAITSLMPPDLEHFIFYGTLLGYHREKNIISWDGDIDFYVNIKHRNEIIEIIKSSDFQLVLEDRHKNLFAQAKKKYSKTWTFVDFYFYENKPQKNFIYEEWTSKRWEYEFFARIPKEIVFPIRDCIMQNIPIKIPNNPMACCQLIYGDDYMIPKSPKSKPWRALVK